MCDPSGSDVPDDDCRYGCEPDEACIDDANVETMEFGTEKIPPKAKRVRRDRDHQLTCQQQE